MNCLVTAGPAFAPLDEVRRLTNFSTGRLGTELADYLEGAGHRVRLLRGTSATWQAPRRAPVEPFDTVTDLQNRLRSLAGAAIDAVFHAAAVSDFAFGRVFERLPSGELRELAQRKNTTRGGPLLTELVPTPKIIAELRDWFPNAFLVGWKYEVDGTPDDVLAQARRQLAESRTDLCVVNGPAYGTGFGIANADRLVEHAANAEALFRSLASRLSI